MISTLLRIKHKRWRMTHCGCTVQQLRDHLEAQFKEGMCWENYGLWEVDHITPVDFFGGSGTDSKIPEVRDHFSNLQPLWRWENKLKRDKINGMKLWQARRTRWTVGEWKEAA